MNATSALATPEQIAKASGSSFLVSFNALGSERRRALTAIYAFCRVADDAADDADSARDGRQRLSFWRDELERAVAGTATTVLGQRLAAAMATYRVEPRHLRAVLDGVQMDLDGVRYATFADLLVYCDRVAAAVGLACLPVFGAPGPRAERYAVALGRALQLTNIARDLRGDARVGRVYVPAQWLEADGVDPRWLTAPSGDAAAAALARLVGRLVAAANAQFDEAARELRAVEDPRALLAPETMAGVYRRLLARIDRDRGRACIEGRRLRVPTWEKVLIAWQTRWRLR